MSPGFSEIAYRKIAKNTKIFLLDKENPRKLFIFLFQILGIVV
jgi:hypothetical protein